VGPTPRLQRPYGVSKNTWDKLKLKQKQSRKSNAPNVLAGKEVVLGPPHAEVGPWGTGQGTGWGIGLWHRVRASGQGIGSGHQVRASGQGVGSALLMVRGYPHLPHPHRTASPPTPVRALANQRQPPPTTTNHQPPITNHQPPTTNHKPQTTNHQPPTTNPY